ncbi:MAG: phosphopantothenoylcysteine decarboxylase/phosphopantothenate/cysteine ligase [Caulobacteraceae bacterium]|nr:phosphopantothenoylcysteine decarboxylase/phosphopantothenate/cysteine ligase [Caulobacteraceae bacterium]
MSLAQVPLKRVLLIVGGGVGAYKALELIRLVRKAGIAITPILTRGGAQFVTPLSLSSLSESRTYDDLFAPISGNLAGEEKMGHIELSRSADLVVVVPATADLMAKAAAGLADDLASTTLLATDKPVLMAPAMNVRMWEHAATQANLAVLKARGVEFVGPGEGEMACGEYGMGRLAEPAQILEAIQQHLETDRSLVGRHALITAGPTAEPIDAVRVLTNRSSGAQGYAIAAALARKGASVTLVSGPTSLSAPAGVKRVDVQTARDMLAACKAALPADVAVCVAAVADWRPDEVFPAKLKKGPAGPPSLTLVENPDILRSLCEAGAQRPGLVIGFAAETENLEENAKAKLARKGCDYILGNDVARAGLNHAEGEVMLVSRGGIEPWGKATKTQVADRLAALISEQLS